MTVLDARFSKGKWTPAEIDLANPPDILTRAEAALYLHARWRVRASKGTLATWASKGGGPPYCKIGNGRRNVVYRRADLDAWAQASLQEARHEPA